MDLRFAPISFDDVDTFSAWETDLGWTIESTQLTPGVNRIDFDHFAFPELLVSHFRSHQGMQNLFVLPDDGVLFTIARNDVPAYLNGHEVPATMSPIMRGGGREHLSREPAGFDVYEFITTEGFVNRTELFPSRFFELTEGPDCPSMPLVEPLWSQFVRLLDAVFELARNPFNDQGAMLLGTELLDTVVGALRCVIDGGVAVRDGIDPRPTRRGDLLPEAEDFMRSHLRDDLSADDIATALGVSYRVLHYAIEDAYGISPAVYFRNLRLHAVRRLLMSTDMNVTDASFTHGFYSPSRFSAQYRRLFGELPSQTRAATAVGRPA